MEADFFRGLAILLVVWDHTMVDLAMFYPYGKKRSVLAYRMGNLALVFKLLRALFLAACFFCVFTISGLSTAFSK